MSRNVRKTVLVTEVAGAYGLARVMMLLRKAAFLSDPTRIFSLAEAEPQSVSATLGTNTLP